jgi:hypothetical protein
MSGSLFNEPSTNTAAINTDVVIDLSAISKSINTGRRCIKHIGWSLDKDPLVEVRLTVESPVGTVLYDTDIIYGGKDYIEFPNNGIPGAVASIMRVKLAMSSSNTVGTLNVLESSG